MHHPHHLFFDDISNHPSSGGWRYWRIPVRQCPMQWVSGGGRLILGELCFLKYVWRGPILEQLPLTVYQSFTILE